MAKTKIVFGAAGTGKTTFIINHIRERFANPDGRDFTYVTFTKSAAEDFKKRLLKEFELSKDDVKDMMVGTQHAICYRLIGREMPLVEEKDRKDFCEKIKVAYTPSNMIQDDEIFTSVGDIDENLPLGNKALAFDQMCRMRMTAPTNLEVDEKFSGEYQMKQLENFMSEWGNYKKSIGKVDYTDMLEMVLKNKLVPQTKRGYFDEFQDYGALQYAVYSLWRDAMEEVIVAGDDDQCIFSYSGASPDFMLKEKGERVILETNHRNAKEIYEIGLDLIERNVNRVEKNITCINPKKGEVQRIDFLDDGIEGLQNYIKSDERTFILVRTNRQLSQICDVLDAQLIPYMRLRHGTAWTPEFISLINAFRKINTSPDEKLSADELHALIRDLPAKDYIIRGKKSELMKLFDEISFNDLKKLYLKSETQMVLDTTKSSVNTQIASLTDARIFTIKSKRQKAIATRYAAQKYPQLVQNLLYIGTFHSSKGLEADTVILSDALPKKITDNFENGTLEEERRVYYVGITRAKYKLIFAYGLFENTQPFLRGD